MQLVVNIVVLAAIYALIACGYVLVYRVSRVLNLAHGELMMLGAYLLLMTASQFSGHWLVGDRSRRRPEPADGRAGLRLPHAQDDGRDGAGRRAHHRGARHPPARRHGAGVVGAAAVSRRKPCGIANFAIALPGGARISLFSALLVLTTAIVYGALLAFLRFGRWGIRMRAAGQNPLLAAQRGINLHAVYALAWGLSTLTGALAGILISLDSGLDQTMAIIGLKAFPAALVGGLDSLVGALLGSLIVAAAEVLLIHYVDPLLSEVVPFLVLIAMLVGAALGPARHARGARPCLGGRARAAISAPATRQDLRLVETRTERWRSPCLLVAAPGVSVPRLALPARSRQPGVPGRHRRPRADAADGLRGPDLARPCRPARGRRLHGRHPVQGAAMRRSG